MKRCFVYLFLWFFPSLKWWAKQLWYCCDNWYCCDSHSGWGGGENHGLTFPATLHSFAFLCYNSASLFKDLSKECHCSQPSVEMSYWPVVVNSGYTGKCIPPLLNLSSILLLFDSYLFEPILRYKQKKPHFRDTHAAWFSSPFMDVHKSSILHRFLYDAVKDKLLRPLTSRDRNKRNSFETTWEEVPSHPCFPWSLDDRCSKTQLLEQRAHVFLHYFGTMQKPAKTHTAPSITLRLQGPAMSSHTCNSRAHFSDQAQDQTLCHRPGLFVTRVCPCLHHHLRHSSSS